MSGRNHHMSVPLRLQTMCLIHANLLKFGRVLRSFFCGTWNIGTIGEQALWSWRGVIKFFARGGHKKIFQGGAGGGVDKIFLLLISAF